MMENKSKYGNVTLAQVREDELLLQLQKVDHVAVFAFVFHHFASSALSWGTRLSA